MWEFWLIAAGIFFIIEIHVIIYLKNKTPNYLGVFNNKYFNLIMLPPLI